MKGIPTKIIFGIIGFVAGKFAYGIIDDMVKKHTGKDIASTISEITT